MSDIPARFERWHALVSDCGDEPESLFDIAEDACDHIGDLEAAREKLEDRCERLENALESIQSWAGACPLDIFQEPRINTRLGAALKALRKRRSLSLREVGTLAEVDHAYVHRLESGEKTNPSPDLVQKLLKVLKPDEGDAALVAVRAEGLEDLHTKTLLENADRWLKLKAENKRLRHALECIALRCHEGDPRTEWTPTILDIAHKALENKP